MIHIPSLSADESLRLGLPHLAAVQNAHICCLYQLLDPAVHLLYVSPCALSGSELAYHDRFLAMLGVSTLPKRLHFVVPELVSQLA